MSDRKLHLFQALSHKNKSQHVPTHTPALKHKPERHIFVHWEWSQMIEPVQHLHQYSVSVSILM